MKIFHYFLQGGPFFAILVTICGLLVLFFSIMKIIRMASRHEFNLLLLDYILLFGSLAVLFGILDQAMDLFFAMKAIAAAGDISVSLLAEGFRLSLFGPIYGLIIFLVSLIFWAVLKEINLRKESH